uniref:uncharacterized protein LOC131137432 isoform X2 n=1 Tax=Doryrhamphus excisus TaxID=161450 RepID=UPI0025ADD10A|nr:uncharacterized protein LOC131137432 isoform X2 [Doryrhamphus excisus]
MWTTHREVFKDKTGQFEDGKLTLCIIQLLMAYFNERTEELILFADMSATAADVERTLTLPASPRVILLGLAAVFATFYVFNLRYQEEAARTLEFVQSGLSLCLSVHRSFVLWLRCSPFELRLLLTTSTGGLAINTSRVGAQLFLQDQTLPSHLLPVLYLYSREGSRLANATTVPYSTTQYYGVMMEHTDLTARRPEFNPTLGHLCVEFACSPRACVGFLQASFYFIFSFPKWIHKQGPLFMGINNLSEGLAAPGTVTGRTEAVGPVAARTETAGTVAVGVAARTMAAQTEAVGRRSLDSGCRS